MSYSLVIFLVDASDVSDDSYSPALEDQCFMSSGCSDLFSKVCLMYLG